MSLKFGYKALSLAVISTLTATAAYAAGLDRSGQDITAFLQEGTYAETVYTYIDADVSGKDTLGRDTGDVAESYDFFRYGVKADLNDTFSIGVLYDEPFGAAVQYGGNNNFVHKSQAETTRDFAALAQKDILKPEEATSIIGANQLSQDKVGQGTNVEIRTNNLTMLVGAKLGANKNFQIYGGPAAQRVTGEVHLRGITYQSMAGYDAKIATDTEVGWVAGMAFYKPEIALKAALTYRSEIEHETSIAETIPIALALGKPVNTSSPFSVTLPESWNLDFQTGVNPTTLLTAKVRYVPWSDFDIRPTQYTETTKRAFPEGLPIVSYDKDQWSAEVGLGKRVTDRLAVSGAVGWDSGAGNPTSTLGPIKGYYSLGLGARYNFTPEWSLSLGGKYFKFGDADARIPPEVYKNSGTSGRFEDNDGYAVGVKLAYHAK